MDAFTADECDSIIDIGTRRGFMNAETGGRSGQERRNSQIRFLMPSGETGWMFRRMASVIEAVNPFFQFDLTVMNEGIQFTRYESPGSKYDWHSDYGPGMTTRKLSLTVQLTDPDDYDGGELELNPEGNPLTMDKVRGRAFAFPSWTLHRVKPVTKGVRHSLVVWVAGPPFR
jgi:PKHD-type hydroxylase